MRSTPNGIFRFGRPSLALRFPKARRDEIEGDLIELWHARRDVGRRDLRRAYVRDVLSLLLRVDAGIEGRSLRITPRRRRLAGVLTMTQDFRLAFRLLIRRPISTLAVVLALAVGIGAGAAIFTAVDRLLLRALPFPDAERVVWINHGPLRWGPGVMGTVEPSFIDLPEIEAAGTWASGGVNLDADANAIRIAAAVVDDGFFAAVGVPTLVGRPLPAPDGTSRFAVLSYELWRTRFGGDRAVIGESVSLNSRPYVIVGVMPPGFSFPGRTDVWIPPASDLQATGAAYAPRVVARMAPGTTLAEAVPAVEAYDRAEYARQGRTGSDETIATVVPFDLEITKQVRPTLLLLTGSVALLVVVICGSVANLLLSRVAARDRELTIRRALGASRWALARQMLAESLLLTGAGGALGAVLAHWALDALRVLAPAAVETYGFGDVDEMFLLLATGGSVVTALLFGTAPGLAAARQEATQVLGSGRSGQAAPGWRRFRNGLVIGQLAVSLALFAASLATVGALLSAIRIDPGFGSPRALVMTVTLPLARFEAPPTVAAFFERARDRIAAVPGVRRTGATGFLPGSRETGVGLGLTVRGSQAGADAERLSVTYLSASPEYFVASGIRVLAGRGFADRDRASAPRVIVLSETTVRELFPAVRSPLGQMVEVGLPGRAAGPYEVIGVVADVRLGGIDMTTRGLRQMYVSLLQSPPFGSLSFVIETEGDPAAAATAIRDGMRDVDPLVPIYDIKPMDAIVDEFLASRRLVATLVAGFTVVTLLVAAIGLYGLMAQQMTERAREFGIRLALGANPHALRWHLVVRGAGLGLLGAAIGSAAALSTVHAAAAMIPAIEQVSAMMLVAGAAVLVGVGVLATWLPAARVLRIDPSTALRE